MKYCSNCAISFVEVAMLWDWWWWVIRLVGQPLPCEYLTSTSLLASTNYLLLLSASDTWPMLNRRRSIAPLCCLEFCSPLLISGTNIVHKQHSSSSLCDNSLITSCMLLYQFQEHNNILNYEIYTKPQFLYLPVCPFSILCNYFLWLRLLLYMNFPWRSHIVPIALIDPWFWLFLTCCLSLYLGKWATCSRIQILSGQHLGWKIICCHI